MTAARAPGRVRVSMSGFPRRARDERLPRIAAANVYASECAFRPKPIDDDDEVARDLDRAFDTVKK